MDREQIVARIEQLQKEIDAATGWGAGVSVRHEEMQRLKYELRRLDFLDTLPT